MLAEDSLFVYVSSTILLLAASVSASAQSTATVEGRVVDPQGAAVPSAKISLVNTDTSIERTTFSDGAGIYQIAAVPAGPYRLQVQPSGFRTNIIERLNVAVARILTQNFQLELGDITEAVNITTSGGAIQHTTISVGQVVDERTVQELPLNGRHFIGLGLLVPGSVTPQNGFLSAPAGGQGSAALNTAGNREDTGNYQVNGITLNDQINNTISFLPSISSIQEFKFDNSTFSAEYGRNSGSVVNIATRHGTNEFHGEIYEFIRNDALDARNFFNVVANEPPPFRRNQFGVAIGGPLLLPRSGEGGSAMSYNGRNRTFFFVSYEGLRQQQGLDLNSRVLSDQQRASITNPIVQKLADLIPRANFTDASGTPRFIGATTASVVVDQPHTTEPLPSPTTNVQYPPEKSPPNYPIYVIYRLSPAHYLEHRQSLTRSCSNALCGKGGSHRRRLPDNVLFFKRHRRPNAGALSCRRTRQSVRSRQKVDRSTSRFDD